MTNAPSPADQPPTDPLPADPPPKNRPNRMSLLRLFGWITVIALVINTVRSQQTIRHLRAEVERQRDEVGYVWPSGPDEIAAARAPCDEPLMYKFCVRVPEDQVAIFRGSHERMRTGVYAELQVDRGTLADSGDPPANPG